MGNICWTKWADGTPTFEVTPVTILDIQWSLGTNCGGRLMSSTHLHHVYPKVTVMDMNDQFTSFSFNVDWPSHYLDYSISNFHIEKSKIKVMGEVRGQGFYLVHLVSNQCTSFSFHVLRPIDCLILKKHNRNFEEKKAKRPDSLTGSTATLTLGPEIRPSGHIIVKHLKVPHNSYVKQEWCKASWNLLGKWLNAWIIIYFRAQNDPEIGHLRPIFNRSLRITQFDM